MLTFLLTTVFPALIKGVPGLFSSISAYLQNKQNTAAQTTQAELSAVVAANQAKAAYLTAIGPMIVACTAGELMVAYLASIVLDSMFHFHWDIAKLPPPWDERGWFILSSFFFASPLMAVTSQWVKGRSNG